MTEEMTVRRLVEEAGLDWKDAELRLVDDDLWLTPPEQFQGIAGRWAFGPQERGTTGPPL